MYSYNPPQHMHCVILSLCLSLHSCGDCVHGLPFSLTCLQIVYMKEARCLQSNTVHSTSRTKGRCDELLSRGSYLLSHLAFCLPPISLHVFIGYSQSVCAHMGSVIS